MASALCGALLGRELDNGRDFFPAAEPAVPAEVPAKAPPPPSEQTYEPWELVSV